MNVDIPDIQGTDVQQTDLQPSSSVQSPKEEDEQTDEATLNRNKDSGVNIIPQPPVQENQGTHPQINQGLSALRQMDKNDTGPVPVGVQVMSKQRKGNKKTKVEGLDASIESSQGSNAQAQIKTASTAPKPKVTFKKGTQKPKQAKPEPKNFNDEDDEEQSS
ncbi:MAG: hypothetical protein EZS28_053717 [Streblomastix strix]|uniref:Uncharacterized protein n=1 Tax=Streblomastix strix TaxID=222440 RepID=A0A5J4R720_9EUKA|nr:MAG: hypothetical protein EZS28_053717 [Streblomastix strix]